MRERFDGHVHTVYSNEDLTKHTTRGVIENELQQNQVGGLQQ